MTWIYTPTTVTICDDDDVYGSWVEEERKDKKVRGEDNCLPLFTDSLPFANFPNLLNLLWSDDHWWCVQRTKPELQSSSEKMTRGRPVTVGPTWYSLRKNTRKYSSICLCSSTPFHAFLDLESVRSSVIRPERERTKNKKTILPSDDLTIFLRMWQNGQIISIL